ncbi:MAG: GNAT family N-acetyltransferase [Planctomycetia bacterium]|nr:GNAT family N-acetyltransferase [Planctomycetia bacterium]
MATVLEINDLETLSNYQLLWNALLARTPDRTFFHSYDWFVARVRDAGSQLRPRVLVVSDATGPIGILPLVVTTQERRLGRFRVLGYPLSDWGAIYGPIGSRAAATLNAGIEHIRTSRRDWDVLDLCWVNTQRVDQGQTARAMHVAGFTAHEALHAQTAQIELSAGWQAWWDLRVSHWRTNLRRSEKRLAEAGAVRYLRYRPRGTAYGDDDPRWDLFNTCVDLAARSWQGKSADGTTMSHASVEPFLRDVHAVAARRGALDLNLLLVDERPVAFAYNYHYDGSVYGLRMGYDDKSSPEGAGSVLLCRTIEDSCRRGDTLYDLGPGYLECKRQWYTRLTSTYRYTHFPLTAPRAQAVRLARWVKRRVGPAVSK